MTPTPTPQPDQQPPPMGTLRQSFYQLMPVGFAVVGIGLSVLLGHLDVQRQHDDVPASALGSPLFWLALACTSLTSLFLAQINRKQRQLHHRNLSCAAPRHSLSGWRITTPLPACRTVCCSSNNWPKPLSRPMAWRC
ncbi:hypothetical protein ACRS2Y_27485 [Pseudomonas putida]